MLISVVLLLFFYLPTLAVGSRVTPMHIYIIYMRVCVCMFINNGGFLRHVADFAHKTRTEVQIDYAILLKSRLSPGYLCSQAYHVSGTKVL